MDLDIALNRQETITLVPEVPMTSPVATVYDRARRVISSPTATPSAVSTTVASSTGPDRVVVASATGIVVGLSVRVSGVWGWATAQVIEVDGTALRLSPPLPGTPAASAIVQGLDVVTTVGPFAATYAGYVLEITASNAPPIRTTINCVVYPYVGPCSPTHVRDLLSRNYAGERALISDTIFHQRVAREVNEQIRGRLLASATYLSDYWSPAALSATRGAMLRLVLAESYSLRESGSTRDDYLSGLRFEVRDRIGDLLKSAQLYSKQGNGQISDTEISEPQVTWLDWRR